MSPLEELRHSAAHVLATAVLRLYPDTQLDIGPPTDAGFYYDFDSEVPFTPEVLTQIEEEMKKVIKENQRFQRLEVSREEAVSIIKEMGQTTYKLGRLMIFLKEKPSLFTAMENFVIFVRVVMYPTPRKLKLLNSYMSLVPIIEETPPKNSFNGFMEPRSIRRKNLPSTWSVWRRQKRGTIVSWEKILVSFISTSRSDRASCFGSPTEPLSARNWKLSLQNS